MASSNFIDHSNHQVSSSEQLNQADQELIPLQEAISHLTEVEQNYKCQIQEMLGQLEILFDENAKLKQEAGLHAESVTNFERAIDKIVSNFNCLSEQLEHQLKEKETEIQQMRLSKNRMGQLLADKDKIIQQCMAEVDNRIDFINQITEDGKNKTQTIQNLKNEAKANEQLARNQAAALCLVKDRIYDLMAELQGREK